VQDQAAHERQLREQAVADAKAALRTDPTRFLKARDVGVYDKGIINGYRQLVRVSLLNASAFPVADIRGDVDWIDGTGSRIGSTTFTLTGSIPAGETKGFSTADGSLQSSTLEGNAAAQSVRVTSVTIVEPPTSVAASSSSCNCVPSEPLCTCSPDRAAAAIPNRRTDSYACGAGRCGPNEYCCDDGASPPHCAPHDIGRVDCSLANLRACDPRTNEPCAPPMMCKPVQWSPSLVGSDCAQ
jgi:hypothetical protein